MRVVAAGVTRMRMADRASSTWLCRWKVIDCRLASVRPLLAQVRKGDNSDESELVRSTI